MRVEDGLSKLNSLMIQIRETLASIFHDTVLYDAYNATRGPKTVRRWIAQGRPLPPPHVIKRGTVRSYGQQHNLQVLVETGTFRGDMVYAMQRAFRRIVSIELDPVLHECACRRLGKLEHVQLLWGNSAQVLPSVLQTLNEPALFWLDGHYSGSGTARGDLGSPVVTELSNIMDHHVRNHVILIDDAREFVGRDGYPTIEELKSLVARKNSSMGVSVSDDVIRIVRSVPEL